MNLNDFLMYARSGLSGQPFPQRKPERIQFPVNDVCNARCVMCNVWHQHKTHEVTPHELRSVLQDSLFSEVHGVGLNGGEPTLRRDLPDLASVLIDTLPKLQSLSLITNGLHRQRAAASIQQLSSICRGRGVKLNVMVSLDGVGSLHDFVRGREGNFRNVDGLLDDLMMNRWADSLQIGCTVVRQNAYGIHELLDYAISKGIYIKYRLGVPHRRLYKPADDKAFTLGKTTWPDLKPFQLDEEQTAHFAEFLLNLNKHYEASLPQQWFYRSLAAQMVDGAPRMAGCAWRNAGVTLTSRGELAYCAVESDILGNAIQTPAGQLYWGHADHLDEIKRAKCATCHHDYGGMPEGLNLRRFAKERVILGGKVRAAVTWIKATPIGHQLQTRRDQDRAQASIHRLQNVSSPEGSARAPVQTCKKRVVICGWYGTETAGDKAILGGVIQSLRQALGEISIHLASLYPHISHVTVQQMPDLGHVDVVPIDTAATLIDQSSLIVFGGGPLMAIPRMAIMVGLFERAVKHGIPTMIAGCGVGPMGDPVQNELVTRLLSLSSIRIYRDESSRNLAGKLGIHTADDFVAEDPAFTWLEKVNERLETKREPKRLLLGLRDWPFKDYAPHIDQVKAQQLKDAFDKRMVVALADLLKQHPDLVIAPVPMCTNSYGGDDRFYHLQTLCKESLVRKALDMSLMGRELTPEQYVNEFRRASFAITMRFHSLVFAAATSTPSLAIDYTVGKGKVGALASRLGVTQFSIADVNWVAVKDAATSALSPHARMASPPLVCSFSAAVSQALRRATSAQVVH